MFSRPGAGLLLIASVALSACQEQQARTLSAPPRPRPRPAVQSVVRVLPFPFGADTTAPAIAAETNGDVLVSWIDQRTRSLDIARWRDGRWFQPRTIARGEIAINKANAPALLAGHDFIVAQWIEQKGHGTAVRISRSNDDAATWSDPVTPHPDAESEFGFVSLAANDDGTAGAVWLDGRKLEGGREGAGDMELRYATIDARGAAGTDELLDPRVCDCCNTSIANTANGPVVVYRDRSADEIRDIAVIRRDASGWTRPKPLHRDGWRIRGCPVNGPRVDAAGRNVVTAWFSAPDGQPRVNVAFSHDGAATFGKAVRIDNGHAAGHVDVSLLADGSAVATWIETAAGGATINAVRVARDGTRGRTVEVGRAASTSSAGFPRIAISKDNVVVAWSGDSGVQMALLHIPEL